MQPDGIKELPVEEQWLKALDAGDAISLMELLAKEPNLVSITRRRSKSYNVLHLAVRNDLYGLVLQITECFSRSDPSTPHVVQPQVLGDLLTEKVVQDDKPNFYKVIGLDLHTDDDSIFRSSGLKSLDVLDIALINRHQAINSLLAGTIQVHTGSLFADGHPYEEFIRESSRRSGQGNSEDELNANPERKVLASIFETVFPHLIPWLGLKQAPNMVGGLSSIGDLDFEGFKPELKLWMLISPFLPLSEFLVLLYCRYPKKWESLFGTDAVRRFDDLLSKREKGTDFIRYILMITDTRRTALYYSVKRRQGLDKYVDFGF